jgi:hypothetical protein
MRVLLIVLLVAAACTSPKPAPEPEPERSKENITPRPLTGVAVPRLFPAELPQKLEVTSEATLAALRPTAARLAELKSRRPRLNAWSTPTNVKALLRPISGATFDRTRGAALADFIAAVPPARGALGAAALSIYQTVQDDRLCEQPTVDLPPLTFEGETYEARYKAEKYLNFLEPTPALYALSSTCTAALAASGGATAQVIGAGCTLEDEAAHFEAGSGCRACLDTDGDLERCIAAASCRREMTRELGVFVDGETKYYDVIEAPTLACAPDYLTLTLWLTEELGPDPQLPLPFTHGPIPFMANWFWDDGAQSAELWFWATYRGVEPAVGDFTIGSIEYIRRPGETGRIYGNRQWLASELEVEGLRFTAMALYPDTIGGLSKSREFEGGWGFNPQELRPDGTDPTNIEHTNARDWISAAGLKTATTVNGVPIVVINKNLCAEDGWRGPDNRGRYFCTHSDYSNENPPPLLDRWAWDFGVSDTEGRVDVDLFYMVTLAATGAPDPLIPGGHVTQILGSPTLADEDWEGCRYPKTFYPDERANWDNEWGDGDPTYTSQTYRFGKDPELPVRMALATNWRRGFCAESTP